MKFSILALSIFFLLHFTATAQRNFKPGYIVSLSGDTTKGFIDYKEWSQNPRDITFKTTEQSAAQTYTNANIIAFGVNQFDYYQRYIGPLTKGAVELNDLSSGIDSSVVTNNVFLRIVAGGKNLTLFSYTDRIKTRYFIADGNAGAVELKRYVYMDNNRSDKLQEYNFFTQQLLALALKYQPGNMGLSESIQKAQYRAKDLEDIVLKIDGSNNNLLKKATTSRTGLRFFAGLSANSFKTTVADENTFLAQAPPSSIISPAVNLGVDIFFNKNVGKWIFRTEVGVATNKVNFDYQSSVTDYINVSQRNDQVTFKQFTVAVTPQIIFNFFNKPAFKAYVATGAQINFTNYSNYKYTVEGNLNGERIIFSENDKNYLRKTYPNAVFKAGAIVSKRFEIYAAYNTTGNLRNYASRKDNSEIGYSYNVNSYRFGVNYLFGGK